MPTSIGALGPMPTRPKTARDRPWRGVRAACRGLLTLGLLVGCLGAAQARAVRIDFEATINGNNLGPFGSVRLGETVSGHIDVDFDRLTVAAGSQPGLNVGKAADPSPLAASGAFTLSGGLTATFGVPDLMDDVEVRLLREGGADGAFNVFSITLDALDDAGNRAALILGISDSLGARSQMFSTPPGDLSLGQPINWLAPGTEGFGFVATKLGGQDGVGFFDVTALSVHDLPADGTVPVPAPLGLLLAALPWVIRPARARSGSSAPR